MKNILSMSLILLSTTIMSNELSWVDEQVEAIKPSRVGMSNNNIRNIKNPFIFLKKNRPEEKILVKSTKPLEPQVVPSMSTNSSNTVAKTTQKSYAKFELSLILNNAAMIGGKWYRIGDKINGYLISEISTSSVLLRKKKKNLLLSMKNSNSKINFKNK